MAVKNIVFDIGNVLVKWDPATVIQHVFADHPQPALLTAQMFKSPAWYDLNLGKITEADLIEIYHKTLHVSHERLYILLAALKESLVPIENSFALLTRVYQLHYPLYVLSDNVREIVAYLKRRYDFWHQFQGVVISAEVGHLKPAPEIYHHLLTTYQLKPNETLFIDDLLQNVEGAKSMGMQAIEFKNVAQCRDEMLKLNICL